MENMDVVRRLLPLIKPYRGRVALSFLMMALTAVTEPALAKSLQLLLDKGFGPNKVAFSLWLVPGILLTIFVGRGIFRIIQTDNLRNNVS